MLIKEADTRRIMLIGIIVMIGFAAIGIVIFVLHTGKKAEKQKYYDAAYKVIKEDCLNNAIRNQNERIQNGQKIMLYLKWKDSEKRGYVFDPLKPIRIGRSPENSDICIREETVSSQHCMLYLYQGEVYLKDLNSRNGTWLKQGLRKQLVQGVWPVFSGDKIMVGNLAIQVIIFTFDMAYV